MHDSGTDRQEQATLRRARPRFAPVPEALIFGTLSDRAVRLWAILDRVAGASTVAMPRIADLADALRCSRDSIERALAELRAAGWLEGDSGQRRGSASSYVLADRPTKVPHPCGRGAAPMRYPLLVDKREVERTPQPPASGGRRANGTNPRAVAAADARAAAQAHPWTCECHGRGVVFYTGTDGTAWPRPCTA